MQGLCWQHRIHHISRIKIKRHGGPAGIFCGRRGTNSSSTTQRMKRAQSKGGSRIILGAAAAIVNGAVFWAYYFFQSTSRISPLNPDTFAPFTIIAKEVTSSTNSIFTLKPSAFVGTSSIYSDAWKKGIWSVQAKQPQLQIARSYTPLPPAIGAPHLRLLLRREPQGEVSTYLHRLPLGATVELRGPHMEYEIPEDVDEVMFLAGGTGIAPALQTAYNIFGCRKYADSVPKLRVLWANRRKEDSFGGISDTTWFSGDRFWHWANIFRAAGGPSVKAHREVSISPVVKELEVLKEQNRGCITVNYFVDEEGRYITEDVLRRHLKLSTTTPVQPTSPRKKLILLSGPEGFIRHFAGPKTWVGGKELQGPLGGILGSINPGGWDVWKL